MHEIVNFSNNIDLTFFHIGYPSLVHEYKNDKSLSEIQNNFHLINQLIFINAKYSHPV